MEQVTKESLIEDFIKEITKLYQDDKSYKGRDYIFNVDWGIFKDNYRDWIYARKELTYTDFLLFWNECGWIISSIKEDGDMRVSGLSKSEEFLFDLAYHQVKEYNKR